MHVDPEHINGFSIPKSYQVLPKWKGKPVTDDYGNKPVLDYNGEPLFPEIYILRLYQSIGYEGVWVDPYGRKFRTDQPEKQQITPELPKHIAERLAAINPDKNLTGTWDLLLWKGKKLRFVELKNSEKDKLRPTQVEFLERALKNGMSEHDFEIFEWEARD